jgi:hypothetical protein
MDADPMSRTPRTTTTPAEVAMATRLGRLLAEREILQGLTPPMARARILERLRVELARLYAAPFPLNIIM